MNFVAQLEDHLRDLGAEARKKHPGVKEASERAVLKLRSLQNAYVGAVRKASSAGEDHPSTAMFRSSDLLHPFLLAANYPNASSRLLEISFKAIQLLMEADAICPGDGMNLVRVWMIQAQVVVSYSSKDGSDTANRNSDMSVRLSDSQGASKALSVDGETNAPTKTSGSWLGSILGSTPSVKAMSTAVPTKTAVSSSHGQAGPGHLNAKDLEKLALDILRCLLQLLELRDLPIPKEQWIQSISLCCLLSIPSRQTVRQAAHSTLPQVLHLLFKDSSLSELQLETWDDLLLFASQSAVQSKGSLTGAFSGCRAGESDAPQPPSPALSFELMATLLEESPSVFSRVAEQTFEVLLDSIRHHIPNPATKTPEFLKLLQCTGVVLRTQNRDWASKCTDVVSCLLNPVSMITDTLRKHADFEDGFIYKTPDATLVPSSAAIETLQSLQPTLMWKTSLCLDQLKALVSDKSAGQLWKSQDALMHSLETVSDFCTIGASCRSHMNLVVLACRQKQTSLTYYVEALSSSQWQAGKGKNESYILGEALLVGMRFAIKLIEYIKIEALTKTFAPAVSVLQHYLKRFPGCGAIVEMSLEGYFSLAQVSLKEPVPRHALFTSLCKLSLPHWGSYNPACQLRDHNIAVLICLLNIVHRHYNDIFLDWSIVLQTFQELSSLAISSPHLSDSAYVGALSISAVYSRLTAFSTCFSDEAIQLFVDALAELSSLESTRRMTGDIVLGAEVPVRPVKDKPSDKDKDNIGKAIMNIGVRAIYGGNDSSSSQLDDVPVTARTRSTYSEEFRQEFSRRMSDSKYPIRLNTAPYITMLTVDVVMSNLFRHGNCVSELLRALCKVAQHDPANQRFIMDTIALSIISQLSSDVVLPAARSGPGKVLHINPRQNQYFATERSDSGTPSDTDRSSGMLQPLCESIQDATEATAAELGAETLHMILESCGHRLDEESWVFILRAIESLSSPHRVTPEWASSCLLGFRCLKLIIDDFIDQTNSSTSLRGTLLDCCSSFGSSVHDVNTCLTAIGFVWSVADQDTEKMSIHIALEKLVILSSDSRAEVRNCAVNTFFSCLVGSGASFNDKQWRVCLQDMVFRVFEEVTSTQKVELAKPTSETPTDGKRKSRYRVSVHHSRDSADKQWITTQALVLRGLTRVLRCFFESLLETMSSADESVGENETPWFEEVWNRILSYSFEATRQTGGRDTVDVRLAGVELLVLCAQLSCAAGMHAAISPARVGTSMSVVNGALRSIGSPPRQTNVNATVTDQPRPEVTEMWRENLFLDAFDVLDSYREHLVGGGLEDSEDSESTNSVDSTQIQILTTFASELGKLYECCRDNEFEEDALMVDFRSSEILKDFPRLTSDENDPLILRFTTILWTVARISASGPSSRYLSQAQRACLDVFRNMVNGGSSTALRVMADVTGRTVFHEKNSKNSGQDSDILCLEAAGILDDFVKGHGNVTAENAVLVAGRLLSHFSGEAVRASRENLTIEHLAPAVVLALQKVKMLQAGPQSASDSLLKDFFKHCFDALSILLLHGAADSTQDTINMLEEAVARVPLKNRAEWADMVASAMLNALDAVRQTRANDKERVESLNMLMACFRSLCQLDASHAVLSSFLKTVLDSTRSLVYADNTSEAIDAQPTSCDLLDLPDVVVCMKICETIVEKAQESSTEAELNSLLLQVFPQLCQLIGVDEGEIRRPIGELLAVLDISQVLEDAEAMRLAAEERAVLAEIRVVQLEKELVQLRGGLGTN